MNKEVDFGFQCLDLCAGWYNLLFLALFRARRLLKWDWDVEVEVHRDDDGRRERRGVTKMVPASILSSYHDVDITLWTR